jgi:SAM-dependent methyltransferase
VTTDTGYHDEEGLAVYEAAMALPYLGYARYALSKILRKAGVDPATSLDLACGSGHLVKDLSARGWRAYGCDLSPDMVARAAARYPDLRDHFFVADMSRIPPSRSYDLVTVVFNSIHYLSREGRGGLWRSLAETLADGGLFVSQQTDCSARETYWLKQSHVWTAETGYAVWTGGLGPSEDVIEVEKLYFERQEDGRFRLFRATHPYHFFPLAEMHQGLAGQGIEVLSVLDGRTLGPAGPGCQSVWVVARKKACGLQS